MAHEGGDSKLTVVLLTCTPPCSRRYLPVGSTRRRGPGTARRAWRCPSSGEPVASPGHWKRPLKTESRRQLDSERRHTMHLRPQTAQCTQKDPVPPASLIISW